MNSIQESKISMYLGTCDLFNTNAAIVNPLPNFQGYYTTLKTSIISIQNFGEFQNFDKTGLAITKKQAKLTLSLLAADTARKLTALAAFTNNQVLLNEMNYSDSDFKRCTDAQLRDVAQGIYNRAQTNLTALTPYGATAATQTSLQTAITNFVTAIPKPRVGIAEKKQSTLQLQNYFKIADNALANIDIIINLIKLTQPNFYSNYKTIRKIVNTSTGSLILKGLVTDVETGEPIKGAIVEFSLDGNSVKSKAARATEVMVKKTAAKGRFNVKTMPAGVYSVTVKKNGYAPQVETIAISEGDRSDINIQLTKN
jgi:hypothetical protein